VRSTQLSVRDLSGCPRSPRHGHTRRPWAKSQDTMFFMTSFGDPSVLLGSQLSKIPLESGLDRQDDKRPDGLTLIPWHGGRSLVWDVTVVSALADSYIDRAATDTGVDKGGPGSPGPPNGRERKLFC